MSKAQRCDFHHLREYVQVMRLIEVFNADDWTRVFGSEHLTGALLDRLTHHFHILRSAKLRL